jgi:uncharacterized membrane protein YfcA
MTETLGYFASALIGISLGLIGCGGSIMTIPVMVYLFHIEPTLASAYSLFVVGTTALIGGIRNGMNHLVDFRTTAVFATPSFITVFITRRWVVPVIPQEILSVGSWVLTRDVALMAFFGVIMLVASISMIRMNCKDDTLASEVPFNLPKIMLEGMVVGLVTGLVGAGGGFLIIPALVLFAGLPMKKAVGTSLVIISINSLIGFLGDIGSGQAIDYAFITLIAAIAVAGIFVGSYLSRFIEGQKLKTGFGWFVLVMGIYIILKEMFF